MASDTIQEAERTVVLAALIPIGVLAAITALFMGPRLATAAHWAAQAVVALVAWLLVRSLFHRMIAVGHGRGYAALIIAAVGGGASLLMLLAATFAVLVALDAAGIPPTGWSSGPARSAAAQSGSLVDRLTLGIPGVGNAIADGTAQGVGQAVVAMIWLAVTLALGVLMSLALWFGTLVGWMRDTTAATLPDRPAA